MLIQQGGHAAGTHRAGFNTLAAVNTSFIQPVSFKAVLSKPALMDFIAKTPAEAYFLVIPATGNEVYGIVISEDVIEYLTNEFTVHSLEFVPPAQVQKVMANTPCKKSGNYALLEF
jgi:hypothetical protein